MLALTMLALVFLAIQPAQAASWVTNMPMTSVRYFHTATLLSSGKVLVAGGYDISDSLASAELYDPAADTWTATGSMTNARAVHTATLLPDGRVLVAGGYFIQSGNYVPVPLASAELFDPSTGIWTMTGSMTNARVGHTATLLPNRQVLVAGGPVIIPGLQVPSCMIP